MKHKVRITQTFRVEKWIVVEVEADTIEDALAKQSESDAPGSNEGWTEGRVEFTHEEVEPA